MDELPKQLHGVWHTGSWLAVSEILGGAVNRVYAITAIHGRFVLRRYRAGSAALLRREAEVTRAVSAQGLPAIPPLRTLAGDDGVEVEGSYFGLFPFAAGVQREASALSFDEVRSAGAVLGRLHRVLAELPIKGRRAPRLAWDGPAWAERLTKVEEVILARPDLSTSDHIALDRVRAQRAWLSSPECRHADDLPDRLQITHGDYHHRNLFFADQQVSGIIDWEQTGLMPRAYEAIRAATYMFGLEADRTRQFLQAWMAEAGGTRDELHRGAEVFAVVRDHWVWALEEVYLSGNTAAAEFIPAAPFEPFLQTWSRLVAQDTPSASVS